MGQNARKPYALSSGQERKACGDHEAFVLFLLTVLLAPAECLSARAMSAGRGNPRPALGPATICCASCWTQTPCRQNCRDVAGPNEPDRPLVVIDAGHGGRDPGAIRSDREGRENA